MICGMRFAPVMHQRIIPTRLAPVQGIKWPPLSHAAPERTMARIRHIVFHTTDVERLAKFYVDVMGLKIVQPPEERRHLAHRRLSQPVRSIPTRSTASRRASTISASRWRTTRRSSSGSRSSATARRSSGRATGTMPSTGRSIPTATISTSPTNGYEKIRKDRVPAKEEVELKTIPPAAPAALRPAAEVAGSPSARSSGRSRRTRA